MRYCDPASSKAHIRHGCKTGLAAVLAYGTAQLLGFTFGHWAAITAVIVMQTSIADSLQMGWYRLTGTAMGAIIGISVILLFPANTFSYLIALFLSVGFCAYMTRYSGRYRMAAITVCIVTLASYGQPEAVLFGLFRVLEIAVGVICAIAVSLILWPQRLGEVLRERLRGQFAEAGRLYQTMMEAFIDSQKKLAVDMLDSFSAGVAEDSELYRKVTRHERLLYHEDTRTLGLKVEVLGRCTAHLRAMLDALNSTDGQVYEVLMQKELRELAKATVDGMRAVGAGQAPSAPCLEAALELCAMRLTELRSEGVTQHLYLQNMLQFFAFYHGIQYMAWDLLRYAQSVDTA